MTVIFIYLENTSSITDSTTIDSHFNNLFLHAWVICLVTIGQHERFSCTVWVSTPVTLCPICTSARLHDLVAATVRAGNFLVTFHADYYITNDTFNPLAFRRRYNQIQRHRKCSTKNDTTKQQR